MKRYAEIKDNLIKNVAVFEDDSELPKGWVNITDKPGCKGDIVIKGKVICRPTKYHTEDSLKWVLTAENKMMFDEEEKKISNSVEAGKIYSDLEKGVEVSGVTYSCNKDDIDSLHDTFKLVDLIGDKEINIEDIEGNSHTLHVDEFKSVCREIGKKYSESITQIKDILK
jgi:hypothetical protein